MASPFTPALRRDEHSVATVRQHPAAVLSAVAKVMGGLGAAIFASWLVTRQKGALLTGIKASVVVDVIWVMWAVLLLRSIVAVLSWTTRFITITSDRIVLADGFLSRTTRFAPLV